MLRFVSVALLFLSFSLFADDFDFRDFDSFQETLTSDQVFRTLTGRLVRSPEIWEQLTLTKESLSIYANADDKKAERPEFVLKLIARPGAKLERVKPGLKGLKVAIDPGHFGGDLARPEGRYVDMKPVPETGNKNAKFDEGTLSAMTGRHLKKLLEREGAEVMLTRDTPGKGAIKETFEEWSKAGGPDKTFKIYNGLDLRERAKLIKEFKPDVSVAIHFNAGGSREKDTSLNIGTHENYNMIFVGGSFMTNELATKEARYEFVRLLVDNDLPDSIELAQTLGKHLHHKLQVPLIPENTKTPDDYLGKNCLIAEKGVYCRNLPLTRLPRCTAIYGESLYQDNYDECLRLASTDFEIDGYKTSSRVRDVAEAYFEAIREFFGP